MGTILIGFQKASLEDLKYCLENKKHKIIIMNSEIFSKQITNKPNKELNLKDRKLLKNKILNNKIILGTSEKYFESNIANYFDRKKINYSIYFDSSSNLKKRLRNFKEKPKKIITNNSLIKKKLSAFLKKTVFKNIDMCFQRLLKKKYGMINRNNNTYLYVTSNLGIKFEKKYVMNILNLSKSYSKKFIILVHPRENILKWRKQFKNYINSSPKKNLYSSKNIKYVFGISTMALINFKFAGFDVRYFNQNFKKNELTEMFKKYNIKPI